MGNGRYLYAATDIDWNEYGKTTVTFPTREEAQAFFNEYIHVRNFPETARSVGITTRTAYGEERYKHAIGRLFGAFDSLPRVSTRAMGRVNV